MPFKPTLFEISSKKQTKKLYSDIESSTYSIPGNMVPLMSSARVQIDSEN